ncbi:zinc-binding dehydrogenase [Cellulomonas sp. Sa3CUA2]|uniref:Zinc-binding dehydrogenase n=2 Tax=Cellulomonas avistercoris TaxID=2762242 RepID=A0ABR8QGQ4_9CELL|nr:zinc-binding dehydrogenase [Cellulomonas avistercoris]
MTTVPATMRAAVLRAPGAPLSVEEVPTPRPARDEVLVRVAACGVCHTDLHVMDGSIAFPTPAVPGHEVSGTVVALGPEAERYGFEVGMNVAGAFLMPCGRCEYCGRGRDDMCTVFYERNRLKGQLFDGTSRLTDADGATLAMYSMAGMAEYAVVPVTALAPLPDGVDPVAGAILGCAALTAYGAVRRAAELEFGETVAVVAVGGVGSNLVQLARVFGAREVIAVDVDDEKLAAAERLGATRTVNSRTVDARAAVLEATGGRGVDVAFEVLGSPGTFAQAVSLLAAGGRMVPVGLGAAGSTAEVEINQVVRRGLRIIGNYGARTRVDLPAVVDLAARGLLRYQEVVTRRFALAEVNDAYGALARGEIQGRAVVTMGTA